MPGKEIPKDLKNPPTNSALQYSHENLREMGGEINRILEHLEGLKKEVAHDFQLGFFDRKQELRNLEALHNAALGELDTLRLHAIQARKNTQDNEKKSHIANILAGIEEARNQLTKKPNTEDAKKPTMR